MTLKCETLRLKDVPEKAFWIFLTSTFFFLIIISTALADQRSVPIDQNDQARPAVSAVQPGTAPAHGNSSTVSNSIDFIMPDPPLSQSTATGLSGPKPDGVDPKLSKPLPLQALTDGSEEMALLVSEQCDQSGDESEGTISCSRIYSNGNHAKVITQRAHEGDEFKQQAVIEEYDRKNNLLSRKTIRHRVDYNYLNDQKAKEQELFDIVYQPAGKKTTRELMIYQYYLDTGKPKSLSWTQYRQIGDEPKAGLSYHASLRYGADGTPERGIAEQWAQGVKADTFLNWSSRSKGFADFDQETWDQWESWIRNVSLQAYLP